MLCFVPYGRSFIDLVPYICTCVPCTVAYYEQFVYSCRTHNREMEEIGIIDAIKDEALPSHAAKAGGGADASASAEELDSDDLYVR